MKNATVVPSSRVFTVRIQGAPERHGWAVRYKSGSSELDAAEVPLWISEFRPQENSITFGENPWLWESETDANKIVEFLRENMEVETKNRA